MKYIFRGEIISEHVYKVLMIAIRSSLLDLAIEKEISAALFLLIPNFCTVLWKHMMNNNLPVYHITSLHVCLCSNTVFFVF